jgi:hypothetical protein
MKSFRRYITEVAQQGFQYEINAVKALKPLDIVPQNFTPAGAGSDIPDLMIKNPGPGNPARGCELKITAASAGSLVMKWNNGSWSVGNENEKDDEKIFVMELAKEVGILDQIQRQWKNEPYKFTTNDVIKSEIKGLGKRDVYSKELARFPEIKGVIPATKIEEYYNKKKTYYVNVGTHGFFLLGTTNPLKLKNVPRFGNAASAGYRARVQAKGGGNYQFTFEMSFSISRANTSPFNIAPTIGKTVMIDQEKMERSVKELFGIS